MWRSWFQLVVCRPFAGGSGYMEVREDKVVVDVSADPVLPERSNVNLAMWGDVTLSRSRGSAGLL
jgi:hypothetical protein